MDDDELHNWTDAERAKALECPHVGRLLTLIETPDRERPGYLRGVCANCGEFIGYRNSMQTGERRSAAYARNARGES